MEIVGRKSKSGAAVLMTGRGSCGECSSKVKWQVWITWRNPSFPMLTLNK